MTSPELFWLPVNSEWASDLESARDRPALEIIPRLRALANSRIDFLQTAKLDRVMQRIDVDSVAIGPPVRMAILSSCTTHHLVSGIRVGGIRRGLWIDVYEAPFGAYRQELQESGSQLHKFKPDVILFAFDSNHIVGSERATVAGAIEDIRTCWHLAKQKFGCAIIQQTLLPVFPSLLGNNEHLLPNSPLHLATAVNAELRSAASAECVHLLAIDVHSSRDGLHAWHDEALWHRSKEEIHPRVSHIYGDQVARVVAALRGRSCKCLVLDLDNTLWGGVIGDEGLDGIILGQGHALGEAYVAFQHFIRNYAERGIILAVCSKNNEDIARSVFESHPEMVLKRDDIAVFVANWRDKATNIREIAKRLEIGLDSIVFIDDNPVERSQVRSELPMVAVPELPEDPSLYAYCISSAGYFEALSITAEDTRRGGLYKQKAEIEELKATTSDLESFLTSLQMKMTWGTFDTVNLPRIVQLINKTNQFNLTTKRYTTEQVSTLMADSSWTLLHFRLSDRFGDNGLIAVVMAKAGLDVLEIDTWLMSCRVLGRRVEEAVLDVLVSRASALGLSRIIGRFSPTPKNAIVQHLYRELGFSVRREALDHTSDWQLEVQQFEEKELPILIEGMHDDRASLFTAH